MTSAFRPKAVIKLILVKRSANDPLRTFVSVSGPKLQSKVMDTVSSQQIAEELGITRRHVLRQIDRRADQLGIKVIRGRRNEILLSRADADALVEDFGARRRTQPSSSIDATSNDGFGYVYVIQLLPKELSLRHKLGYTDNVEQRLRDHRTTAPTLELVKAWRCKPTWEKAAIAAITNCECEQIGGPNSEVYDGDTDVFVERAGAFFSLMPQPNAGQNIVD